MHRREKIIVFKENGHIYLCYHLNILNIMQLYIFTFIIHIINNINQIISKILKKLFQLLNGLKILFSELYLYKIIGFLNKILQDFGF